MLGYYPNVPQSLYMQETVNPRGNVEIPEQDKAENNIDKESDFSQTIDVTTPRPRSNSLESTTSSFHQSVQVVPASGGKYEIYPGAHDKAQAKTVNLGQTWGPGSLHVAKQYRHNISNQDLRRNKLFSETDWQGRKKGVVNKSVTDAMRKPKLDGNCNCGKYHSHTFTPPLCVKITMNRETFIESAHATKKQKESDVNQLTIYYTFWCANLAFSEYKHGRTKINFQSLWPKDSKIMDLIKGGVQDMGLRNALWDLCVLSILTGPLSVLRTLLELSYIRIDYQFENDPGLLHLACLLRNVEAAQMLIQKGVPVKMKDRSGLTAGQVCYCPKVKKQLPTKLQSALERNKSSPVLKPGLQDKDAIFRLAASPRSFYEVQKKLQVFEFSVNTESNEKGDFILHTACRSGLCQLPLIISLVRLQGADVDLCNSEGMTPLMIAAADGDSVLCDTLMCFFGANPNKCNERTGQTALHYAVAGNHDSIVNCLIKRGADVNIEDKDGYRPDDILALKNDSDDGQEVIAMHRKQRNQQLSEMVKENTVYPIDLRETDLHIVDSDGYTLVMLAAKYDRVHNLETLLSVSSKTINAQHGHTGLTALGMAAAAGHHEACRVLLRLEASPSIADMQGYMPLHQAVLGNHEMVIDVFKEFFPAAYLGLFEALKFCRRSSIHDRLTGMWERRQEEIVNPKLRLCAMEGDAGKLYNALEPGDNVNCKSDLNSQPALFIAVQNGHLEVVELMKERGADLRKRDQQTGSTILHIVAQTGNIEMARYLLQYCKTSLTSGTTQKLDINAMNNEKKTALQIAAKGGYIKMTSLFIEHGATTAILNKEGALFTSPEYEGVRLQIEAHRLAHTKEVMKLVSDKSKKALLSLEKIWLPRFDHNLRDQNGDTPLMVACRRGRVEVIKLLLQSAVYANHLPEDDEEENSDADSGIPDLPPWTSRPGSFNQSEDLQTSIEQSHDFGETFMGVSCMNESLKPLNAAQASKPLNPGNKLNTLAAPQEADVRSQQLKTLLQDVERPKGLYIYHDGIVSHVCAVNLFDGNTPVHRAIEGGDNPSIVSSLLEADGAVINMQNGAGLTAVHLACKLGRKKVLEKLLAVQGVDTSLRSLNGYLPEEMTTNKSLIRMVHKARKGQPVRPHPCPDPVPEDPNSSITGSVSSLPSLVGTASTINVSKIMTRYNKKIEESQQAAKGLGPSMQLNYSS